MPEEVVVERKKSIIYSTNVNVQETSAKSFCTSLNTRLYPLEISISDLPPDIAENKMDGAVNDNSDRVKSSATNVPKTLIPETKTLILVTGFSASETDSQW
ncbi:hypothetical protein JTE90_017948 [Oedothorax gibbosus]|uniref:Uncharacterized protein n=1 Tax=Oedothorax gibbosus TaxID=931172 RepID=A0AAV6V8Y6_9ARAC|nr:hypothetical protein JTE90_017948 [Oedothorax gibbosus]